MILIGAFDSKLLLSFAENLKNDNCEHNLSFPRSSLASYILGLDEDSTKNRKHVEDMFFSLFSALLDALLSRAQVYTCLFPLLYCDHRLMILCYGCLVYVSFGILFCCFVY